MKDSQTRAHSGVALDQHFGMQTTGQPLAGPAGLAIAAAAPGHSVMLLACKAFEMRYDPGAERQRPLINLGTLSTCFLTG